MKGKFAAADIIGFVKIAATVHALGGEPNIRAHVLVVVERAGVVKREKIVAFARIPEALLGNEGYIKQVLVSPILEKLNSRSRYYKSIRIVEGRT